MSEKQTFQVLLEKDENSEATGITIPFDVEKIFGGKRVPVKVMVNGVEHRSTVVRMGGKYVMVVPKRFREAANIKAGEMITVQMERDTEARIVTPPDDLAKALNANPEAKIAWDNLSYTHKREHVTAIEDAKKEETRARRIARVIEQIVARK